MPLLTPYFFLQTEPPRTVGKKQDKIIKEIELHDNTGEIKASLWGPAAVYTTIELGQHVTLADCKLNWSKHQNIHMLSVGEADQITVSLMFSYHFNKNSFHIYFSE